MSTMATHRVQGGGDQIWITGATAKPQTTSTSPASDSTPKAAL